MYVIIVCYHVHDHGSSLGKIRATQLDKAVDRITGSVQGAVEAVFPWADEITARSEWSYVWRDDTEGLKLARTEANTVEPAADTGDGDQA
jgi:hypothetical protein